MTLKNAVFGWVGKHWWKLFLIIVASIFAYQIWQWMESKLEEKPSESKSSQDEVMDEDETV